MATYVFSVASRWGAAGNPDDVEVVRRSDRTIGWPMRAHNLREVVYFADYSAAGACAGELGPHREGAHVSVVRHDADAPYVGEGEVIY